MSIESARLFFNDCKTSQLSIAPRQLLEILLEKDESEILPFVHSLGYSFSTDEMLEVIRENHDELGVQLSADELSTVIGGKSHLSGAAIGGIAGGGGGAVVGAGAAGVGVGVAVAAANATADFSLMMLGACGDVAAALTAGACF